MRDWRLRWSGQKSRTVVIRHHVTCNKFGKSQKGKGTTESVTGDIHEKVTFDMTCLTKNIPSVRPIELIAYLPDPFPSSHQEI